MKKVSMNSYEVRAMTTLITFRWTQSLLQRVQMTLLGCANTSHIIQCQIWPPPQHCIWCHLWWVWRTRTLCICFVRSKPPGSTTRVQLCTLYILLTQFFYWCFHRTRSQLEDGSIIMCADAFPAFLWAGNPPGHNFNEDNMLDGLFKGYLLLHVRPKFLSNDTVCHCRKIRLQPIYSKGHLRHLAASHAGCIHAMPYYMIWLQWNQSTSHTPVY